MTFQFRALSKIEADFNITVQKELKKHNVKTLEELQDAERREQLLRIRDMMNECKSYPSSIPTLIRQQLVTAVLLEVKDEIGLSYSNGALARVSLGALALSPTSSLVYNDIDSIVGIFGSNPMDAATRHALGLLLKRHRYFKEHGKVDAAYLLMQHVIPQLPTEADKPPSKLKSTTTIVKGMDVHHATIKGNYVTVEADTLKSGAHALNAKIIDRSFPPHYLSDAKRSLKVETTIRGKEVKKTLTLPSERKTYSTFDALQKSMLALIHGFDKTKLRQQAAPAAATPATTKPPLSVTTSDNAPNHRFGDIPEAAAKAHYFKKIHAGITAFDKAKTLRAIPKDAIDKQEMASKRRLGKS